MNIGLLVLAVQCSVGLRCDVVILYPVKTLIEGDLGLYIIRAIRKKKKKHKRRVIDNILTCAYFVDLICKYWNTLNSFIMKQSVIYS